MSTGSVKMLNVQINLANLMGLYDESYRLSQLKSFILTNGYQPPIPQKQLNQRQIRKRKRQKAN